MPSDLSITMNRPPFSFASAESNTSDSISAGANIAPTSVEILSNLNYKYIHASNTGNGKYEGDLEKSKNQVRIFKGLFRILSILKNIMSADSEALKLPPPARAAKGAMAEHERDGIRRVARGARHARESREDAKRIEAAHFPGSVDRYSFGLLDSCVDRSFCNIDGKLSKETYLPRGP